MNSELSYGEKFALHAAVGVARSQAAGSSRGGGSSGAKVVGGTASQLSGGKFANGARTAGFQYLFNERGKFSGSFKRKIADFTGRSKVIYEGRENIKFNSLSIDGLLEISARVLFKINIDIPPTSIGLGTEYGRREYEFKLGTQEEFYTSDGYGGNREITSYGDRNHSGRMKYRPIEEDTTVYSRERFQICILGVCN